MKPQTAALFQFTLLTVITSASDVIHTVLLNEVKATFDVPTRYLNWLNAMYLASYVVFGPLTTRVFTRLGLRRSMLVASALNLIGCSLKVIATIAGNDRQMLPMTWLIFAAGQLLVSMSINFAMAGPTLLTSVWFESDARATATFIATGADAFGIAFGAMFPGWMYSSLRPHLPHGLTGDRRGVAVIYGVMTMFAIIDSVFNVIVVKKHPDEQPQLEYAVVAGDEDKPVDKEDERSAWMETAKLCIGGSLFVGAFWSHAPVFVELLLPFGFTERSAGSLASAKIVLGMPPALLIARWIDRHRVYKGPVLALVLATLCVYGALAYGLLAASSESVIFSVIVGFSLFILGVCQNAVTGIIFEFAVEASFPYMREEVSAGWFMWGSHAMSALVVAAGPIILGDGSDRDSSLGFIKLLTALTALSLLVLSSTKERYRRLESECD